MPKTLEEETNNINEIFGWNLQTIKAETIENMKKVYNDLNSLKIYN